MARRMIKELTVGDIISIIDISDGDIDFLAQVEVIRLGQNEISGKYRIEECVMQSYFSENKSLFFDNYEQAKEIYKKKLENIISYHSERLTKLKLYRDNYKNSYKTMGKNMINIK